MRAQRAPAPVILVMVASADGPTTIEEEIDYRLELWAQINAEHQGLVSPTSLRELGIYAGQRGIYADSVRTKGITGETAIAIGLLHTGKSYADDLFEDGVLYHYPQTNQPAKDSAEVAATKTAYAFGVPLFTITPGGASARQVYLSWVEGWDDEEELFIVSFSDQPPAPPPAKQDPDSFDLFAEIERSKTSATARPGQAHFKFRVIQRYGTRCAVCPIEAPELLQAAHLVPVASSGSDDPRNGLVLCYTHHRALDVGLFEIEPESMALHFRSEGPDSHSLGITATSLGHLNEKPHTDALQWRWKRWNQ